MIRARCLCGDVRIEITGQLGPIVHCHCSRCRKASGAAFGSNADVRSRYWNVVAGAERIREFDSSPGVKRAFCSRCGSPLYARMDAWPGLRRVRLGGLDGDPGSRPQAHLHVASKAAWDALADDGLARFDAEGPPALGGSGGG